MSLAKVKMSLAGPSTVSHTARCHTTQEHRRRIVCLHAGIISVYLPVVHRRDTTRLPTGVCGVGGSSVTCSALVRCDLLGLGITSPAAGSRFVQTSPPDSPSPVPSLDRLDRLDRLDGKVIPRYK